MGCPHVVSDVFFLLHCHPRNGGEFFSSWNVETTPQTNIDTQNDGVEKGDFGFEYGQFWCMFCMFVKFLGK